MVGFWAGIPPQIGLGQVIGAQKCFNLTEMLFRG